MESHQEDNRALIHHLAEFIAYFELVETKMREWQQALEVQAMRIQQQQEKLQTLTESSLTQIDQQIRDHLKQYDPQEFRQIAKDSIIKSNQILQSFQIRLNFFAVITTILTAFIVVLYLNGELPWEMHSQAKNERQAGKLLLQVWPKLTQAERTKIAGVEPRA